MNGSKVHMFLFVLIGNYFFTLLVIGLVAALISLLTKPKPLRINTVVEAFVSYYMLFTIGISNLVNFVSMFSSAIRQQSLSAGNKARFKRKWDSPVSVAALLASLHTKQVYHSDSPRNSARRVFLGSSGRSYLSNDSCP
jgi:hypothetical protein